MSDHTFRRRRAVLRTALTWAAAWAAAGGALVTAVSVFDPNPAIESLPERLGLALMSGVAWGVRFGVAGAAIGAAFSVAVRFGYRGRRLADIHPGRFALLGAIVGGVGVPLFLQLMNVLSGDGPIAWGLVTDDGVWAAVFGAAAAAGSILLARRAEVLPPGSEAAALGRGDDAGALPAAECPVTETVPRGRTTQAREISQPEPPAGGAW